MSIWSEAITRALNEPVPAEPEEDLHAVPRRVSDQQVADIPDLKCKADCIDLAIDMAAETELIEFRAETAARAERLAWLRKANSAARCHHVLSSGETCGCPARKGEEYCRFHGQAHAPEIEIPLIEDADSLQVAYMSIAQQLTSKKLDAARARVLLQTIECAARNLESYDSD
jgi:hypothetical protein